jgi:pimeloyl-ACP methyl ester carboxylesterase
MGTRDYFWHKILKQPYKLNKVIDTGSGDNLIVLVHGLASKSQIWLPLVEIMDKNKYRIISYDLLGFGSSPKPNSSVRIYCQKAACFSKLCRFYK